MANGGFWKSRYEGHFRPRICAAGRAAGLATAADVTTRTVQAHRKHPFRHPEVRAQRASKDERPMHLGRILRGPLSRPPQDNGSQQRTMLTPRIGYFAKRAQSARG